MSNKETTKRQIKDGTYTERQDVKDAANKERMDRARKGGHNR
jgi:hypothetical protein